jgi:hypothetical protein
MPKLQCANCSNVFQLAEFFWEACSHRWQSLSCPVNCQRMVRVWLCQFVDVRTTFQQLEQAAAVAIMHFHSLQLGWLFAVVRQKQGAISPPFCWWVVDQGWRRAENKGYGLWGLRL